MPFDTHPESSIYEYQPEPDVWWGAEGIDALLGADGTPYAELAADGPTPAFPEIER